MNRTTKTLVGAVAIVAGLTATACGSDSDGASTDTTVASADGATTTVAEGTSTLTVEDAWAKASDEEMSAVFGVIHNSGDEDVTITSASSDVSGMVELHETVMGDDGEMMMQEKEGGFVVPAGGELELAPGANHLMLMQLSGPIVAGDEVTMTLDLTDGTSFEFTAIAKDYSGANENYEGGDDSSMDMGSDMSSDMETTTSAG